MEPITYDPNAALLEIRDDTGLIVKIEYDGTIELGDHYNYTDAALKFWEAVGMTAPDEEKPKVVLTPEEAYDQAMNIIG